MSSPITLSYVAEGDILHRVHFTEQVPLFSVLQSLGDKSSACSLSFESRYGTVTLCFSLGHRERKTRYMTNAFLSWGKESVHVIDLPINGAMTHTYLRDTMLHVIGDYVTLKKI